PSAPFKVAQWTKHYGPVFSLRRGGAVYVVIGRHQAAVEIMERESASLADRPYFVSAGETLESGMRVHDIHSGPTLNKLRRAMHDFFQGDAIENHKHALFQASGILMFTISLEPNEHHKLTRSYATTLIHTLAYAYCTSSSGHVADMQATFASRLLERLPTLLQPSPGSWKTRYGGLSRHDDRMNVKLHKWHVEEGQFHKSMVDSVRGNSRSNTAAPCFTTHLLSQQSNPEDGLSDDELACLVGSMFGAGADTIASAISIIIMAAATHPLAQTHVQEELDRVVGDKRAPTFDDEKALPMTMAFMLESFRWRPVTVRGYPHRATKDIIWKKYVIPKGAIVVGNHWAIAHDPDVFPKPDDFNPLRWLDKAGRLRDDMKFFNYGFGQRACPGQDLANHALFIATAHLLWAFRISEDPKDKIDTMKFTDSVNLHPEPFAAVFQKRGEWRKELL
ncbi:hypothetical protein SERLA73DRAFT_11095, partial [Serpula lacrymans var. lacrymans S7.3]